MCNIIAVYLGNLNKLYAPAQRVIKYSLITFSTLNLFRMTTQPSSHQTTVTTQPRPETHVSLTTLSHTTPEDASEEEEEEEEDEEKDKEPCDEEDQLDSSQENHPDGRTAGMFVFTSRFRQFFQWGRNRLVNLMVM